jgi:endonuclease YncB( thermonuclease family)
MKLRTLITIAAGSFIALSAIVPVANAHPGRTDSNGCHNDRKNGGYHCHGGSSGSSGSSGQGIPIDDPINLIQLPGQTGATLPTAIVVSVGDGDTFRVKQGNQTITVRLACTDAPEKAQKPYGEQSTTRLKQLLPVGQAVQLRQVDRDRYGRSVAEVFIGNQLINLTMIQEGQAVAYRQYLNNCNAKQYLKAESEAKQKRLAFWRQPNPVMPWNFRKSNR